jgi:hypothetical protein
MLNIFIDPKAAVDRFRDKKYAWLGPVLFTGAVSAVIGWMTAPVAIRVMLQNPPEGVRVEQLEQSIPLISMMYKIGSLTSPIIVGVMTLVSAAVLLATCSIMDIKAKLGELYNLVAFTSLVSFVQVIAMGVVLYLRKDDIQNMAELQPAFGLNLLLPDDANRLLQGFLGYISPFNLWYIVILAFAFAYLKNVPRGRAFAATAPIWILGLLFTIAGSVFRKV